jgi:spore coat protein U-like protein
MSSTSCRVSRSLVLSAVMFSATLLAHPIADAQQTPATVTVSGSVTGDCKVVSGNALDFGTYDPIAATSNPTAVGTVTYTCTAGSSDIALHVYSDTAVPANTCADSNSYVMTGTSSTNSGKYLCYSLYRYSVGGTQVGNDGTAGGGTYFENFGTTDGTPVTQSFYGQVPAQPQAYLGNYTDTIYVNVTFKALK